MKTKSFQKLQRRVPGLAQWGKSSSTKRRGSGTLPQCFPSRVES